MLLLASPNAQSICSAADVVQNVEQIGDVEADIERFAGVVDFELFLRFFLLVVGARYAQAAPGREHPAHASEFFVRQDRRALQRLQEQHAVERDVLLVVRRDDPGVVGKLAVDDLGRELDRAEAKLAPGSRRARCRPASSLSVSSRASSSTALRGSITSRFSSCFATAPLA